MGRRRTLDPTLDVVFKLLLTSGPDGHEVLVALLTAVLRPAAPFARVTVRNPEIVGEDLTDRGIVLDLSVELADGRLVDIEMQSDKRLSFRERALFYWARLFGSELDRGDPYDRLRPVISVLFVDYVELIGQRLHSTFQLLEVHDHQRFTDAIELHVIELPKVAVVTEREQREEGDLLLWGRFFRAKTDEELETVAMANPALNKAREVLERVSADPVAQDLARKRQLARITWQMDLQEAIAEGEARGRAEGEARGEARGRVAALRATITDLCELLGISLDAERSAWVDGLDEPGLESLRARLKSERRWPSGEAP